MKEIIIGTRGSKLALWQAHFTQEELKKIGIPSRLEIIKTKGDAIQHLSFDKIEGKGFFTQELEDALYNGSIDMAVHSMKDLPTSHPQGLVIAGVSYRANPHDVLLINNESLESDKILKLGQAATIGTSSARRKAQLKHLRPDVLIKDIRGNVPTRINKLLTQEYDAIVLAAAGLERLGLQPDGVTILELHHREFVPAPAQGILAYQCHEENYNLRKTIQKIHHQEVANCSNVERKVLQMMDGGCHLPLGVYCEHSNGSYRAFAAFGESLEAPLKSFNMAQSTTAGMAEKIHKALTE